MGSISARKSATGTAKGSRRYWIPYRLMAASSLPVEEFRRSKMNATTVPLSSRQSPSDRPKTGLLSSRKPSAFGPVLHVAPFDDDDKAIAFANDTQYGLSACTWTENLSRAHRVAPRVRFGHAWINSWQIRDLLRPLIGARASGVGDQGGRGSLEFSSLPLTVTTRIFDEYPACQ